MTDAIPRRLDRERYALQVLARDLLDMPEKHAVQALLERVEFKHKRTRLRNYLMMIGAKLVLFQCKQARQRGEHLGYPNRALGGIDGRKLRYHKQAGHTG